MWGGGGLARRDGDGCSKKLGGGGAIVTHGRDSMSIFESQALCPIPLPPTHSPHRPMHYVTVACLYLCMQPPPTRARPQARRTRPEDQNTGISPLSSGISRRSKISPQVRDEAARKVRTDAICSCFWQKITADCPFPRIGVSQLPPCLPTTPNSDKTVSPSLPPSLPLPSSLFSLFSPSSIVPKRRPAPRPRLGHTCN